jgi:hypothetical protein
MYNITRVDAEADFLFRGNTKLIQIKTYFTKFRNNNFSKFRRISPLKKLTKFRLILLPNIILENVSNFGRFTLTHHRRFFSMIH